MSSSMANSSLSSQSKTNLLNEEIRNNKNKIKNPAFLEHLSEEGFQTEALPILLLRIHTNSVVINNTYLH